MCMNTRGYYFSFFLISTITTITLPTGSWCAHFTKPDSNFTLKHDGNNVLTSRGHRKMPNFDSKQTEELKRSTHFYNFKIRNRVELNEEKSTFNASKPPDTECTEGKIKHVTHGKFTITGQLETNIPYLGYQSDSAVSAQPMDGRGRIRGQNPSGSEESWLRLQPVVECGDEGMTLTVRRRRAVQLLLDRENKSSVPLSQLSPDCGYSVQSSWRDLSLMAQYNACHVTQEDDHYVLPLLWRGTPVKMSCPTSQTEPEVTGLSSLCCSPHGLSVTVNGLSDAEELRVNVRREWTPLEVLAEQCGYTVERRDTEMIITAPFMTCGIIVRDGKHTFSLQRGGKVFTLDCPVSPSELPLPPQPLMDQKPESKEHHQWAPPFYLAPPYYPHPTYHTHRDNHAEHTPTPSPSPSDPVFLPRAPPPPPPLHYQTSYYTDQISPPSSEHVEDSSEVHPHLQEDQEAPPEMSTAEHFLSSDAGFPTQVEAPPLQQPGHTFEQYYHYYHHPKIPLMDPTRNPGPGPELPKDPPPHRDSTSHSTQTSEASTDPFSPPVNPGFTPEASEHIHPPPAHPHHYFYYYPHIKQVEAKSSPPLNPKPDNQNSESDTFLSSHLLQINQSLDEMSNFEDESAESIKLPLLSEEANDGEVAGVAANPRSIPPDPSPDPVPEQPTLTPPAINYHPYYPYYLQLYYYYLHLHQLHFGAQSLHINQDHISAAPSKPAPDPLPQTTTSPPQPPTNQMPRPPSKTITDTSLHPFYHYYHLYYQPEESEADQKPHHPPPRSDLNKKEHALPAADDGFPSMHQPLQSLYFDYISPHHSCDSDEGEEEMVDVMEDQLQADPYSPSSSPCGLGRVSDIDCSTSPGSCLYSVEVLEPIDCSVGEQLIFVVPDFALHSLPAHPSEVFDQNEFYLLEDSDFFSV